MKKYSVIIPAYNAEKTINRCLDSILGQNRDDVEVIIINDGSSDNTDRICHQYLETCKNIRYTYKQNEGVSIARNTGIIQSLGEYILFVDSDDYVCNNLFYSLDQLLNEYKYDCIVLSYISSQNGKDTTHISPDYKGLTRTEALIKASDMIASKQINSPCGKLYKAFILKNQAIDFTPHVSIAEDRSFNIKYAMYIETIRISSIPGYVVTLDNPNSLSRGIKKDLNKQFSMAEADYKKEFNRCNLSATEKKILQRGLDFCDYRSVYSETKRMHLAGKSKSERRRYIKQRCCDLNRKKLLVSYSKYNLMIIIPVKLRLISLIDFIAYKLAK